MTGKGKAPTPQPPASSNWKSLKATLPSIPDKIKAEIAAKKVKSKKRPLNDLEVTEGAGTGTDMGAKLIKILEKGSEGLSAAKKNDVGKYLAIDCEMVGVGLKGSQSVLARVSIVNFYGVVVMDRFVRPKEAVTDYRTWVSGVRASDLRDAPTFEEVVQQVSDLIKDKILIGHAIFNDFQALLLSHPRAMIRDTAAYKPLQQLARTKHPGLKKLAKELLAIDIQKGSHSSIDDARATMAVYRTQKDVWENGLRTNAGSATAPLFKQTKSVSARAYATAAVAPVAGPSHSIPSADTDGVPPPADEEPNTDDIMPDPLAIEPELQLNISRTTAPTPPKPSKSSLNLSATLDQAAHDQAVYETNVRNGKPADGPAKKRKVAKADKPKAPGGRGRMIETEKIGIVKKRVGGGGPSVGGRSNGGKGGGGGGNWWD